MPDLTDAPTDADLSIWENYAHRSSMAYRKEFLRLITAYRERGVEIERLRARVRLCPHCGCKLAEQALENPKLYEG